MQKTNILYFSSFGSLKGGGQKSLLLLFEHLDKNRFTPVCVTPETGSFTEKLNKLEVRNYVVPMGATKSLNLPRIITTLMRIYRIIKNENIDIVHTDGPRNTFYAGIAAKFASVPVITHIRVVDRPCFNDRIMAFLTDHFIFVSKAAKKRFEWMGDKKPSTVIYNGIDTDAFDKYRNNSNTPENREYRIGCIGRIEKAKGQIYLIRAAKKVLRKFPDCRFIFIGETEKDYMEQIVSESSGIKEKVIFTGHLDNPYTLMKSLDLVVQPSISEGFSRVVLESMAMKKPVITTDTGGNPEAVIDGSTGFLTGIGDSDLVGLKILELLEDSSKRFKMGKAGYLRVKELFGIDANIRQVETVYEKVLSLKNTI